MNLVVEKEASKRFARLPAALRTAIFSRLREIAAAPFARHANVTAMKGEKDLFRLRHGDWRVIYRVIRIADEVRVLVLDTRGDIYR